MKKIQTLEAKKSAPLSLNLIYFNKVKFNINFKSCSKI